MEKILVTGSRGLLGTALTRRLRERGYDVIGYDISDSTRHDILNFNQLRSAVVGCSGIVHLAAVSRVIHGELDAGKCCRVNVDGTRNVLSAAAQAKGKRPWIIYASSREVYGQADSLPVRESAKLQPVNIYGRTKVSAEQSVLSSAAEMGLRTSIVRFSNVYGSIYDYRDRVVPAFARGAARGDVLRVEGSDNILDFTYVDDVVSGLMMMIGLIADREVIPTLHLVSGQGTTLSELASIAIRCAGRGRISVSDPRSYDVSSFIGDPTLAERILGWTASTPLADGIGRLVASFSRPC